MDFKDYKTKGDRMQKEVEYATRRELIGWVALMLIILIISYLIAATNGWHWI